MKFLLKAAALLLGLNALFLALHMLILLVPAERHQATLREAFAQQDLLPLQNDESSLRRGYDTFSDCSVLLMLAYRGENAFRNAVSPQLPLAGHPCLSLGNYLNGSFKPPPTDYYHRYWHGHRVLNTVALSFLSVRVYRALLFILNYALIVAAAWALWRVSREMFLIGLPLCFFAFFFSGANYWGQSVTHAPSLFWPWGIFLTLLLLRKRWLAEKHNTLFYLAIVAGAGAAFFDMMSGAILVTGTLLAFAAYFLMVFSSPLHEARALRRTVAALTLFGGAVLATMLLKQVIAALLFTGGDYRVWSTFWAMLQVRVSGESVSLAQMWRNLQVGMMGMSYGQLPLAQFFLRVGELAWLGLFGWAAWLYWRGKDRRALWLTLGVLLAAAPAVGWFFVFKNHAYIHYWFMGRYLYVPIALAFSGLVALLLSQKPYGRRPK